MANPKQRRVENVPGDFYVDSTCIDCDTCRWMAPEVFRRSGEQSAVIAQPGPRAPETRAALHALLACPTASIGVEGESKRGLAAATHDFPLPITDEIFHCGFHSEKSFGATSYFVRRTDGNVLVDSPRFVRPLVEKIEAMGGVKWLFLTHGDDVADHAKWTEHFACERVMHAGDAATLGAAPEIRITGDAPHPLAGDLLVIPTPGHTRGSACLLFRDEALFTGDHIAYSARLDQVYGFRSACWYDWDRLIASTKRLADLSFEWILPGHGRRCRYPRDRMRFEIERAIAWMSSNAPEPD